MAKETSTQVEEIKPLPPEAIAKAIALLESIPRGDTDDGQMRVLEQILSLETEEQFMAMWRTFDVPSLEGIPVRIDSIEQVESEYAGGLPVFLICKGVRGDDNTGITLVTGSWPTVLTLAQAYKTGRMGKWWMPTVADKASNGGSKPQHLEYLGEYSF